MAAPGSTIDEDEPIERTSAAPVPGLVQIFCVDQPRLRAYPLDDGARELGWADVAAPGIEDARISRRHARVELTATGWRILDINSRNGTFVDGVRVHGEVTAAAPRVLRLGRTMFLLERDVRSFTRAAIETSEQGVIGPRLRAQWEAIALAARAGESLLITGESGTGKELAARAFHSYGPRSGGPFVAVNCAAIPKGVAERLLFGARRGAFSGATEDAEGYLTSADGGTLFLDELGELDAAVQAKLLRVLELKSVLALGAARPVTVDLRVCAATCKDIQNQVATGAFREDLYFRIGRPEVHLPPLRERLEELPWLIARELARVDRKLSPQVGLVEACALRQWRGNVRELLGEIKRAGHSAIAQGRTAVDARDLGPRAGLAFDAVVSEPAAMEAPVASPGLPDREAIEAALRAEDGNVTRAARALGVHRNQLRRWLERNRPDGTPDSE